MFIGRVKERGFLEEHYKKAGSRLVVVYGRSGIGKTALLRLFLAKYGGFYYAARECSEREQLLTLKTELRERTGKEGLTEELSGLLRSGAFLNRDRKSLLVLDEFHLMARGCETFAAAVQALLDEPGREVMVILCSSSVNWVENEMVKTLGPASASISALLKLKALSFLELSGRFPDSGIRECVSIYGILGGVPRYLNYWSPKKSVEENIRALFLNREGRLFWEAPNLLKGELRELSLYNTILAALASDTENMKLNNLYERTGFSRAKISVYLKNLIQLDVVEKVFSMDAYGRENTKKGLYRISDHLIHFWYKYVFPNLSELERGRGETVYKQKVAPGLDDYLEIWFTQACVEYMGLLNAHGRLPVSVSTAGTWFGKNGTIDYAAQGGQGELLIAKCKWRDEPMTEEDLEVLLLLLTEAEMEPDYYYLFSRSGFTNGLEAKARNFDSIRLIAMEDM